MKNTNRWIPSCLPALLGLALCATLASCGGGGGGGGGSSSGSSGGSGATAPVANATSMNWSSPATWGGTLPPAGANIIIPAGRVIVLDADTPSMGALEIEGTLRFARTNVTLTAASINVSGTLEIGTAASPFTQQATITLTGAIQGSNNGVSRGLVINGGALELYGSPPQPTWTKINAHASAGATTLTLKDSTTGWRSGDTITVGPTDFYNVNQATERTALSQNASGTQLTLATPLAYARWGRLQYITATGMSLTPDPAYVPPALPAPTELDERAPVGNLSRNIVIQGANDAAWTNSGFGAHVMVMNLASRVVVDGVEFRRVGQAGVTGRYPFHWHMLSYNSAGQSLGDATGHIIRNSSVWESANRCIVVHGTNGTQVLNNICQDIQGHAFFLEDAVERRNVFDGNLALKVRAPPTPARTLKLHESDTAVNEAGPSGFWLTNPDNTVRNNHAGDASGNGFWMAFPPLPLDLSAAVPTRPASVPLGVFENNTGHSTRNSGILLEHVPILNTTTNQLEVRPHYYEPTQSEVYGGTAVPPLLKRITSFKNIGGAYRNRAVLPRYEEWVSADNASTHFSGATQHGSLARALIVATSLNNATPYPPGITEPPVAFASYHSHLDLKDNTVVNFPFVAGQSSGTFKTNDYYASGVDRGTKRNSNNRLINSSPGYRTLPPHMDGQPLANRHWSLAGALWDPHGYVGTAGQYWVYDVPFLTTGATCQSVAPAGQNSLSCNGEYYGVQNFSTNFDNTPYLFQWPIEAVRQDSNGNPIGTWAVGDGYTSTALGNMRHFAAYRGGRYVLRFPSRTVPNTYTIPTAVGMDISNAYRTGATPDEFVLAVSFSGSTTVAGYLTSWGNRSLPLGWTNGYNAGYVRHFTRTTNEADFWNSTTGIIIWQDTANNLVWIKIKGGLEFAGATTDSDEDLYRTYGLNLYAQ